MQTLEKSHVPYFLVTLDGKLRFSLGGPEEVYVIGRLADCDIRLESRKVSRRHCCLAQVNDYLAVRDLGSTNGIRINGQEVLEGRLRQGDLLSVGPYVFRVLWQRETDSAAAPQTPSPAVSPVAAKHPVEPRVSPLQLPESPDVVPSPSANASAQEAPGGAPPGKPKKTALLEDSSLFKQLEADDPLLGGGR